MPISASRLINAISSMCLAVILTGCAEMSGPPLKAGASEADVLARMGRPTHRYPDGKEQLLEYARGPWGQETYMVRMDSGGRLISIEQVLTAQKFGTIKVGTATKQDVLHAIGAPSEKSFLSLPQLEVWSYPYKESGAWDSMMHVHFDKQGIVRQMMNGPDPNRDPDMHFPFGRHRR